MDGTVQAQMNRLHPEREVMPMFIIDKKAVLISMFMLVAAPAAMADAVTLSGRGVTIHYEDRAARLTGAPSLIATGMMSSPASLAGTGFDLTSPAVGLQAAPGLALKGETAAVSAVGREATPRSFAEGVALRFSLDGTDDGEGGVDSLLLAGLALFALIARQRLSAMPRIRNSALFQ